MRNDGRSMNIRKRQGGWLQIAGAFVGVASSLIGGSKASKASKRAAEAQRRMRAIQNAQARMQRAQELSMAGASMLASETSTPGVWAGGTSARQGITASMLSQQARGDIQGAQLQRYGAEVANQQVKMQSAQNFAQVGQAVGNLMGAVGTAAGPDSWLNKVPSFLSSEGGT